MRNSKVLPGYREVMLEFSRHKFGNLEADEHEEMLQVIKDLHMDEFIEYTQCSAVLHGMHDSSIRNHAWNYFLPDEKSNKR